MAKVRIIKLESFIFPIWTQIEEEEEAHNLLMYVSDSNIYSIIYLCIYHILI